MEIQTDGSAIRISGSMSDPVNDPDEFSKAIGLMVSLGFQDINIEFHSIDRVFPNARVPMAATISHYKNQGIHFNCLDNTNNQMRLMTIVKPVEIASSEPVLSRVCQFNQDSAEDLFDAMVEEIQRETEFAKGSINTLRWCVWEVMDNVANHSGTQTGFLEVQIHRMNKRLAICVADAGKGIKETIRERGRISVSDEDAITLAMKEGFTRDTHLFQGNGLWGLNKIVRDTKGLLTIVSGYGQVRIEGESSTHRPGRSWIADSAPGTVVDFQLDYSKPSDLERMLGRPVVEEFSDKHLDESNRYVIRVAKEARGYATRKSGSQMFMKTTNILKVIPGHIVLDFASVQMISSSFADEFIGKLVRKMGFLQFNELVRVINTEPSVRALINQAVERRLTERARPISVTSVDLL